MPDDRHYSPRRSRSPLRRRDDRERLKTHTSRQDHDRGRSRSRTTSPPLKSRRREERVRSKSPRPSHSRSRSRSVTRRRRRSHSRSRSRSRDRKERKRRDRSASSSSGDERRRRRKKDKERKRSSSKDKHKEEKRRKKEKKDKKKHGSSSSTWGKYGTISESDIFNKSQEFHTWLVEERKINPETISKEQNRKEFAQFVEDYNTATLPHEKYYNMVAFERHMTALKEGEFLPPDDSYDPQADMKALNNAHKRRPADQESFLNRDQLMELRKVQHERVEAGKMRLLGMDVKQNMGVRMDVVEM
ncbi:hypothetical protein M378DRAFT_14388 [Amanita muscaria Koide BX008]|uniref:Uncharacterized protein n=1 Tax=Amanita muscaria (strain Koide BX008) TaxID=946122 RepID=A0A0C2WUU5_AMAMK|nr:hypothetical protein M378DRAFT_14388 [Amanita muscaria Koide BX008]